MTISIGFAELGYVAWVLAVVGLWYSGRCLEHASGRLRAANGLYAKIREIREGLLGEVAQKVDHHIEGRLDIDVNIPAPEGVRQQTLVFRITAPPNVKPEVLSAALAKIARERAARGRS